MPSQVPLPSVGLLLGDQLMLQRHGEIGSSLLLDTAAVHAPDSIFIATVPAAAHCLPGDGVIRMHFQPNIETIAISVVLVGDDLDAIVWQLLLQILRCSHAYVVPKSRHLMLCLLETGRGRVVALRRGCHSILSTFFLFNLNKN